MDSKYSQRINDVLNYSREEAVRLGNEVVGTEHLFLGLLREGEGIAIDILISLGVNLTEIRKLIEKKIKAKDALKMSEVDNLPLTKHVERVLKLVYLEAKSLKNSVIDTGHLLLAILKDDNSFIPPLLEEYNIDYPTVKGILMGETPKNK